MKLYKVFFLIAFCVILTGCLDSPEYAAKEWFHASMNMDGNTILDRTCLDQREYIQEVGLLNTAVIIMPQLLGINIEPSGDVSDITFTTISMNSDQTVATVRVNGEMRVAILAFAQAFPVDETWIMVKEEGAWRWCGVR